MPAIPPQPVQLACPNCRTPIRTAVYTVIDVTAQPELKPALLSGQINVAVCPNCGLGSMLGAPLLYHDAAKQLCLVYFPQELNASPQEQERFIGDTTSFIIRDLPPDVPRAYLLSPRRFLSLGSLLDAVLEADGVSREVLMAQRQRVDLISRLAGALEDEQQFAALAEQNKTAFDYDFFATLTAFIEASAQEGRADSADMLMQLRDRLADLTGFNPDEDGEADPELEEVIRRLEAASDEELEQEVAELRPLIDYSFFAAWTERMETLEQEGRADEAAALSGRRARILEIIEEMDRQAQAMFEAGTTILRAVIDAEDMRAALEAQGEKVDETFLFVLDANLAAAERSGQSEIAARIEAIRDMAVEVIQARLSPEERLINALMLAETAKESTTLLRQNFALITPAFVKQLNELADQQEKRGAKENADRLRQLAREAGAMLF